jgi:hypothetical protein
LQAVQTLNMVADIRTTPVLLFVQPPRFYLYNPPFLIHTTPNLVQLLGTNIIILVGFPF